MKVKCEQTFQIKHSLWLRCWQLGQRHATSVDRTIFGLLAGDSDGDGAPWEGDWVEIRACFHCRRLPLIGDRL